MVQIIKAILLLILAIYAVHAEETDPMARCDMNNEACVRSCDATENAGPECYDQCNTTYYQCLGAGSAEPQPPVVTEAQPPVTEAEPVQ